MHIGCSWYENLNQGGVQTKKWGVVIDTNDNAFHVINLSDNGKFMVITAERDSQLTMELVATVKANLSAGNQALLTELTNEASHKPVV